MKKETTKKTTKRTKRSAKARQQQKLIITGGLAVVLILVIVIGAVVLGGCGAGYEDETTNTLFILEDGKVVSTDVEAFDENTYNKNDLKSYTNQVIKAYNDENGKNSVKQKSLNIKDGVATLVLEYASADVYEDFIGTEVFVGTVAEALEAGYTFEDQFAKVGDALPQAIDGASVVKDGSLKVVVIKANMKVSVEGDILYVSTKNVAEVKENYVVIKNGVDLLELAAQSTETTETELTSEMEGTNGSISEDELLNPEEEEETIVFDFGVEETGSQYSDVYTYIIYK